MKNKRDHSPEIKALDGLRFAAFLLVFFHNTHGYYGNELIRYAAERAWLGVDVFFCLSAYLITRSVQAEAAQTAAFRFGKYYLRRIFRIAPVYMVYLLIGSLSIVFLTPSDTKYLAGHLLSLATFTYNFTYFNLTPFILLAFVHLWSVSFEMQYYLALPLLINAVYKQPAKGFFLTTGLLFVVIVTKCILIFTDRANPVAFYILPVLHIEPVVLGMMLALFQERKAFANAIHAIGPATVLAFWFLPGNMQGGWSLIPIYWMSGLSACWLVLMAVNRNFFSEFLSLGLIRSAGKISYSLYIFHAGLIYFIGRAMEAEISLVRSAEFTGPVSAVALLAITGVVSVFSYHLIEKPFQKISKK